MSKNENLKRRKFAGVVGVAAAGVAIVASVQYASAGSAGSGDDLRAGLERCLEARGHVVAIGIKNPMAMTEAEYAREFGYGVSVPVYNEMAVNETKSDGSFARDLTSCLDATKPQSPEAGLRAAFGRLESVLTADDTRRFADRDEFVLSLPGARDALNSWSRCVAATGVRASSPAEAEESIRSKFDSLAASDKVPLTRGSSERVSSSLAALQAEERAIASADLECRVANLYPGLIDAIDQFVKTR